MRSFRNHLKEKLKDERFRRIYKEEKQLAELSLKIYHLREQMGLSQKEVARRATITQQQLSKVENGINCNMTTFLKVCHALDLNIELEPLQADRMWAKKYKKRGCVCTSIYARGQTLAQMAIAWRLRQDGHFALDLTSVWLAIEGIPHHISITTIPCFERILVGFDI